MAGRTLPVGLLLTDGVTPGNWSMRGTSPPQAAVIYVYVNDGVASGLLVIDMMFVVALN